MGLSGSNAARAAAGHDTLNGNGGDDLILGNKNTDLLFGGDGNDTIFDGQNDGPADSAGALRFGTESLYGGLGDDELYGDLGDDLFYVDGSGEGGRDTLIGGDGDDTAVFVDVYGSYKFVRLADGGLQVNDDILSGIEWLRFSDRTVAASSLLS